MTYAVVTMSRGDEHRIEEWVRYHAALGFDEFHVVLDNPIDDTERVLAGLSSLAKITVETREALGEYYDGMTRAERWERVKVWRVENAAEIAASGMPSNDALAWRQYQHLPAVLGGYVDRDGWLTLLDVDEFIVLPAGQTVAEFVASLDQPRARLLSFDVDTRDHDPARGFTEQHTWRWAREDVVRYGKGWEHRVKTLVRMDVALPLASVHSISRGPHVVIDPEQARILHFKSPPANYMAYSVKDDGAQRVGIASSLPAMTDPTTLALAAIGTAAGLTIDEALAAAREVQADGGDDTDVLAKAMAARANEAMWGDGTTMSG